MNEKSISQKMVILLLTVSATCVYAQSRIGLHEYTAATDDVSGKVLLVGQKLVHMGYEIQLKETVAHVPILSVQFPGLHYKDSPPESPSHAEARAKSIAERMLHAWTLMDHGSRLEVGTDDWNTYRTETKTTPAQHAAIYVRSPVAGAEPLRILTVYPEDVASYPWIHDEKSLADYFANIIQAHYLLFWRNEMDLSKYRAMRLDRTREGQIFKEIATQAVEGARQKSVRGFDRSILQDVLKNLPLSQRERLNRLATTPPMDWESTSN